MEPVVVAMVSVGVSVGINLFLGGIAYGTLRTKVNGNCKAVGELKGKKFLTETAHGELCASKQDLSATKIDNISKELKEFKREHKEDIKDIKELIKEQHQEGERVRNMSRDTLAEVLLQLKKSIDSIGERGT